MRLLQLAIRWRFNTQQANLACNSRCDSYINSMMDGQTPYEQVIELLRAEADAIAKTATRLREDELKAALTILTNCKGKVVVLGAGKSGIIAQKIAATACHGAPATRNAAYPASPHTAPTISPTSGKNDNASASGASPAAKRPIGMTVKYANAHSAACAARFMP